ncbi:MAG: hypothetical protein WCY29_17005, partial [Novosphingobium sp.]
MSSDEQNRALADRPEREEGAPPLRAPARQDVAGDDEAGVELDGPADVKTRVGPETVADPSGFKLRGDPPRVMRL